MANCTTWTTVPYPKTPPAPTASARANDPLPGRGAVAARACVHRPALGMTEADGAPGRLLARIWPPRRRPFRTDGREPQTRRSQQSAKSPSKNLEAADTRCLKHISRPRCGQGGVVVTAEIGLIGPGARNLSGSLRNASP